MALATFHSSSHADRCRRIGVGATKLRFRVGGVVTDPLSARVAGAKATLTDARRRAVGGNRHRRLQGEFAFQSRSPPIAIRSW